MTYVMSDIHGMYDKYRKMLEKIRLASSDTLYILGDVIDRGPDPVSILLDMMQRKNVFPAVGNHELMAAGILGYFTEYPDGAGWVNIPPELREQFDTEMFYWTINGCSPTLDGFVRLADEKKRGILQYIKSFKPCFTVNIGRRTYILVHAGFDNFTPDRPLESYTPAELVWHRHAPEERYFDDESIFVVAGHTPTPFIWGKPGILISSGNVFIDCGACIEGGRLGCIRLEDLREFYVE